MNKHIIAPAPYDVARVREDFPILSTEVYGKPLVYLDNARFGAKAEGGGRSHGRGDLS